MWKCCEQRLTGSPRHEPMFVARRGLILFVCDSAHSCFFVDCRSYSAATWLYGQSHENRLGGEYTDWWVIDNVLQKTKPGRTSTVADIPCCMRGAGRSNPDSNRVPHKIGVSESVQQQSHWSVHRTSRRVTVACHSCVSKCSVSMLWLSRAHSFSTGTFAAAEHSLAQRQ